jgi:hypothetical protein
MMIDCMHQLFMSHHFQIALKSIQWVCLIQFKPTASNYFLTKNKWCIHSIFSKEWWVTEDTNSAY